MILCDTNILIEFYKGNSEIILELKRLGNEQIGLSSITRAELYFGALNKAELKQLKESLDTLTEYPLTTLITKRFTQLMETYSLSHKLSIPDALIAATAIEEKLELFTLNQKDFNFIPEIRLYQP